MLHIFYEMNLSNINAVRLNEIGMIPQYPCPKCAIEMQKGFSRSNGIAWRNEYEPPLPIYIRKQALENTLIAVTGRENIAWYCQECKLILVDHSIVANVAS
jgi:hypothetical protein